MPILILNITRIIIIQREVWVGEYKFDLFGVVGQRKRKNDLAVGLDETIVEMRLGVVRVFCCLQLK